MTDAVPPHLWTRTRWVVLVASVLAILLSGGFLIWHLLTPRASARDALVRDRESVMAVASTFVQRLGTYDPSMLKGTTMPIWRAAVGAVSTPKFAASFDAVAKYAEADVVAEKTKVTTTVDYTAVPALGDAQAYVMVVGDVTFALPKSPGSKQYVTKWTQPYRYIVEVDRTDGQWLADSSRPAEGAEPTQKGGAQ